MRLIDADEIGLTDFEIIMCNGDYKEALKMLLYKISNQPTAYDIDKVVDELEKIRAKETCNKEKCDTKEICRICVVDDAIEIVKQGGVSDDVCEYKYNVARSKDIYFLTSCGHRHNGRLDNSLPYCGFCGKKIKVVE